MKTNITFRTLFMGFLFLFFVVRCTKEGDVGPRGEPGEKGERGERGATGTDGSRIYSGATVPEASLGNTGDFYFRTSNSDFYGPKTASGWGTPTNLRGATGAAGATGSKILSGTAVPATSLGANGDFYFRSTTGDFYGPKTASGWGTPINLKGVKGEDGSKIYSGTAIPTTSLGNVGDFYFRTTTGDFYGPKTASSWGTPTSLKGATGATGATGTPGSKILSGASVPTAGIGAVGDYYIHTATGNLYGPKTASGWGSAIMNLRGAQGPVGPQGPAGSANVIYSGWFTPPSTTTYSYTIPASLLTASIFNQGIIAVYMRWENHGTLETAQIGEGNLSSSTYKIGYTAQIGSITIRSAQHTMGDTYSFRYVLIPGSVQAAASVNFKNFDQVKAAFNIPD